ncbi:WXG100 family type VII secretion target [Mycobacterium sp. NPDC003323]
MLPSRSRLVSWNPDSLIPAATTIRDAGGSIYETVRSLDDRIDAMPESREWAGQAQVAAQSMFTRATDRASSFKNYAESFADALRSGGAAIGAARTALLAEADAIDAGELNVTDQWVVMIDPAGMSAEKAAALQQQAQTAQAEINELLLAVGQADDQASTKLMLARQHGAPFQNLEYGPPSPVPAVPGDDVPDPSTPEGKQFQDIASAQDMATTIRDIDESTDRNGNRITTYTMLDGSKQIATEYIDQGLPSAQVYPAGTVRVLHVDKNNKWISDTMTTPREDGGKLTEISWGDGTHMSISQNPDGTQTGSCTTAEDYVVLPDSFFQDPIPTLAGGALSGLEVQAGKGIQGLSPAALDGLKAGAKFGGPAMGVAQTVLGMYTADTVYERCVAAWSGGVGLAGGLATSVAVGAIPGVGPFAAMGGNVAGGFVFGYVGKLVGNVLCGP